MAAQLAERARGAAVQARRAGAGGGGAGAQRAGERDAGATREQMAAAWGEREGQRKKRKLVFEIDPKAVVVCTNLKQWKVRKK